MEEETRLTNIRRAGGRGGKVQLEYMLVLCLVKDSISSVGWTRLTNIRRAGCRGGEVQLEYLLVLCLVEDSGSREGEVCLFSLGAILVPILFAVH
jgi:hypothetical protein